MRTSRIKQAFPRESRRGGGHILLKAVVDVVKVTGVSREMLRMLLTAERLTHGGPDALLIALSSAVVLCESVTTRTYLASALILAGVILMMPSK